jgi:hypothetical protein
MIIIQHCMSMLGGITSGQTVCNAIGACAELNAKVAVFLEKLFELCGCAG